MSAFQLFYVFKIRRTHSLTFVLNLHRSTLIRWAVDGILSLFLVVEKGCSTLNLFSTAGCFKCWKLAHDAGTCVLQSAVRSISVLPPYGWRCVYCRGCGKDSTLSWTGRGPLHQQMKLYTTLHSNTVSSLLFIYLFIFCLFNDTFSHSVYKERRMTGWLVNTELKREWNEAVVTYFDVISRHLSGGTDENQENLQNSRSPGWDLSPGHPK
jgi:hypothetical protein